jgi:hypothetical protein
MSFTVKAGIVSLSLVATLILSDATALARDGDRADFRAQQRADQRAFAATPHNGVQQRTFATRQMMERRTFGTARRVERAEQRAWR